MSHIFDRLCTLEIIPKADLQVVLLLVHWSGILGSHPSHVQALSYILVMQSIFLSSFAASGISIGVVSNSAICSRGVWYRKGRRACSHRPAGKKNYISGKANFCMHVFPVLQPTQIFWLQFGASSCAMISRRSYIYSPSATSCFTLWHKVPFTCVPRNLSHSIWMCLLSSSHQEIRFVKNFSSSSCPTIRLPTASLGLLVRFFFLFSLPVHVVSSYTQQFTATQQ